MRLVSARFKEEMLEMREELIRSHIFMRLHSFSTWFPGNFCLPASVMNCLTAPALVSSGARPPSVSLHSKGALCGEGLPPRQIRWRRKKKKTFRLIHANESQFQLLYTQNVGSWCFCCSDSGWLNNARSSVSDYFD